MLDVCVSRFIAHTSTKLYTTIRFQLDYIWFVRTMKWQIELVSKFGNSHQYHCQSYFIIVKRNAITCAQRANECGYKSERFLFSLFWRFEMANDTKNVKLIPYNNNHSNQTHFMAFQAFVFYCRRNDSDAFGRKQTKKKQNKLNR